MNPVGMKSELDQTVPSERIRVLVAESSHMASQLVQAALQKHRQKFEVHVSNRGSSETFRELEQSQPDVAVISAELQDGSLTGFRVLHQLRDAKLNTVAVMLLNSTERDLVIDAFRGGARGIFTRADSVDALSRCICAVHRGQVWVSNDQVEFLLQLVMHLRPLQIAKPGGMALLTRREREVVDLVAEGMRNEEVSQKLNITEHTVRNYLCRIFEKLGLSSRVELVLYALSR
jgi:two-component system nitrate/nitrite response regulator NarL